MFLHFTRSLLNSQSMFYGNSGQQWRTQKQISGEGGYLLLIEVNYQEIYYDDFTFKKSKNILEVGHSKHPLLRESLLDENVTTNVVCKNVV